MQDLNVEFETLEEMENYEAVKSARDGHVKQFMDKTGLPKEHAEQYASAVAKYPNNDVAGAEQVADRIAGPKVKVKFHQSGQAYQDKHVAHVKTMKGIMHGTNEEVEVEMESQIDEGINSVKSMVEGILAGHLFESTETFSSLLSDKISERLAEAKIEVAQGIFESKADDLWRGSEDEYEKKNRKDKESEPEKNDEVKDFEHHPMRQLQRISSYEPLTDDEKEANNPNTKRALDKRLAGQNVGNKLTAPKAGGSSASNSLYNHANGEKTMIHKDDANLMVHTLANLKDTGNINKTLDAIHGSTEGLHNVLKIIKSSQPVKIKSIYTDPRV